MPGQLRRFLAASLQNLGAADRGQRLRSVLHYWVDYQRSLDATATPADEPATDSWPVDMVLVGGWRADRALLRQHVDTAPPDPLVIPSQLLAQWWPEAAAVRGEVSMDIKDWWALPYGERAVVDALVRTVEPAVVFEFGTFTGATASLLAEVAPKDAVIHTIDIPETAFEDLAFAASFRAMAGIDPSDLGSVFRDRAPGGNEIVFHRSFTRDFDYSPFRNGVDFIVVDASHEREDVLHDSERALEMLRPGGVIVWDDYDWHQPGVLHALNELGTRMELVHIASTRLVVHRSPAIELPVDFDDEARQLYQHVRDHTTTSPERVLALRDAIDYVERAGIPGAIVECGVYRGGSMLAAALTLVRRERTDRDLYLFDTFSEIPPARDEDVDAWGRTGEEWREAAADHPDWSYRSPQEIEDLIVSVGYPRERVHVIPGLVEETLPGAAPDQIAVLRLDTDWYESTAHEMQHLYPRIAEGGVLIVDDYGFFLGAKLAVDEYFEAHGIPALLHRIDFTGRMTIVHHPSRS